MKAVVQRAYGSADVLRIEDVARPEAGDGEVLVRVRAAAVTQGDWHLMAGVPYLVRLLGFGLRRPKHPVPGQYAAGTVEAVGEGVTELRPGDEVFGSCHGAYAELSCARADVFVPKPARLSFEQAAAVPHGGLAALQALRDAGKLEPGQKVLLLGASGAVGAMAVQIAKAMGAHVTGTCRTAKVDMVRSLGADRVLDYTRERFADDTVRYDLILDMIGDVPFADYRRALVSGGRVVMVSGGRGRWLGGMERVLGAVATSAFSRRKLVPFMAQPKWADLVALTALVEDGKITPLVDQAFPLDEIVGAFRHLESGTAQVAVVVTP